MYRSTLDSRKDAGTRTAFGYLLISLFCAFFGGVYEVFSHGVFSFSMIYAFIFPLAGGVLPFWVISLSQARYPGTPLRCCYHAGVATLTVGSIMNGVLEIYGTTNVLTGIYFLAGIPLMAVPAIVYLASSLRNCPGEMKTI